ncbi:MAG: GyrI-like domain-containing protein [Firmicutes bacterium]|nr:GyrI-like domain-containing protein [Bacillota bacterium]
MRLVERETFTICGYAVETVAAQNDADISALYKDFFGTGREAVLLRLNGAKKGYYGLSWYTRGHEKYCYLLGIETGKENNPPENALLKTLEKTLYAVACYSSEKDIIEAWNEFFYSDIPGRGYIPNEPYNFYFEYYPENVHGDYELWVPVVKADL